MKLNERRFLKLAGLLNENEKKVTDAGEGTKRVATTQKGAYTDPDTGKRIVSVSVKKDKLKDPNKEYAKVVKYEAPPWWRFWNRNPDAVVKETYGDKEGVKTTVPVNIAKVMIDNSIVTEKSADELKGEIEKYISSVSPHLTPKVQKRGVFNIAGDKKYNYYILDDLMRAVALYDKGGNAVATKPFKIPAGSSLDTKVADKLRKGKKKQGLNPAVKTSLAGVFTIDATQEQLKKKGKYLMNQMKAIYKLDDQKALKLARMVALFNGVNANNPFTKDGPTTLKLPKINGVTQLEENFGYHRSIFDQPLLSENQMRFLNKSFGFLNEVAVVDMLDPEKLKLYNKDGEVLPDGSATEIDSAKFAAAVVKFHGQSERETEIAGDYHYGASKYFYAITQYDQNKLFLMSVDSTSKAKLDSFLPSTYAAMKTVENPLEMIDPTALGEDGGLVKAHEKLDDSLPDFTSPSAGTTKLWNMGAGDYLLSTDDKYFEYFSEGGLEPRPFNVKNFFSSIKEKGGTKELNPFYSSTAGNDAQVEVVILDVSGENYAELDADVSKLPLKDLIAFSKALQGEGESTTIERLEEFLKDINDAIKTDGHKLMIDQDGDGVGMFEDFDDNDPEVTKPKAAELATTGEATFDQLVDAMEQEMSLQESKRRASFIKNSDVNDLREAARRSLINLIK